MYQQEIKGEKEKEEGDKVKALAKENPIHLLCEAIETIQNALRIFSSTSDKSLDSQVEQNVYGMALAEFQYANLLKTHADKLDQADGLVSHTA